LPRARIWVDDRGTQIAGRGSQINAFPLTIGSSSVACNPVYKLECLKAKKCVLHAWGGIKHKQRTASAAPRASPPQTHTTSQPKIWRACCVQCWLLVGAARMACMAVKREQFVSAAGVAAKVCAARRRTVLHEACIAPPQDLQNCGIHHWLPVEV
jgi:hypothetical protein